MRKIHSIKSRNLIILIYCCYLLLVGYTYPQNAPNVKVNCALGNNVVIYFAEDTIEYLEVTDYAIINKRQSQIYGYTGTDTRIVFPIFDEPYYNSGYNNVALRISAILENNLYTPVTRLKDNYQFYVYALIGGILLCILIRH